MTINECDLRANFFQSPGTSEGSFIMGEKDIAVIAIMTFTRDT